MSKDDISLQLRGKNTEANLKIVNKTRWLKCMIIMIFTVIKYLRGNLQQLQCVANCTHACKKRKSLVNSFDLC